MFDFIQSLTRKRSAQKVICPACGETRLVSNENFRRMKTNLCSACSKKAGRKPKTGFYRNCERCGKQFWTTPAVDKRFCSKQCTMFLSDRACRQCGKMFKPKSDDSIFCSTSCYHASCNTQIEIKCQTCGKKFSVIKSRADQKFCSKKCQMSRPAQERPNFKSGKYANQSHPYPYGGKWPSIRKWVLDRDGHVCQYEGCKSKSNLQVHHKVRFDDKRDKDYQNSPDNLITLCIKHHQHVHRLMR